MHRDALPELPARPDLTHTAWTVGAHQPQQLAWLLDPTSPHGPEPLDLDRLAVPAPWERKRTLWMVCADAHPERLRAVLDRITPCSSAVLLQLRPAGSYALSASQQHALQELLASGRLSLVAGGSAEQRALALSRLLDMDRFDGCKPVLGQAALQAWPTEVKTLFRVVSAHINVRAMMKSTRIHLGALFLRNTLLNAPWAHTPQPLAPLAGALAQRPVLIVSAGPSLNKQLPLLAAHQQLFTIIAVDTVWPILARHGITPDHLIAVDPVTPASWPAGGMAPNTRFVVDVSASPRMVWSHPRAHLLTVNHGQMAELLAFLGGHAAPLPMGGSVATAAFNLAVHLGANPLVFIGQDLALTGGRDHAEGYPYTYDHKTLSHRRDSGFDVDGYHGGTVRTERQLLAYKTWFEERIKSLPDTLVINATEGGARISGSLQLPFAQVCQEIAATSLRKPVQPPCGDAGFDAALMQTMIARLEVLSDRIRSFQALATEAQSLTHTTHTTHPSPPDFEAIDRLNLQIRSVDPLAKLLVEAFGALHMERVRLEVATDDQTATADLALRRYRDIYEGIQASGDAALGLLAQVRGLYERVLQRGRLDADLVEDLLG